MLIPEEIKKITTEIVEKLVVEYSYSPNATLAVPEALRLLSKDYAIVPKRHIQMRHASCCALAETDPARKDMYMCQRRVLETIFGTELFDEEKI